MKKIITILFPVLLFVFSFTLLSNTDYAQYHERISVPDVNTAKVAFPENIQKILEKSCNACHTEESSSTKGKIKLVFEKFNNGKYSTGKQIAKLNAIVKVLDKGKMPTKKFVAKYPDRALTAEDTKALKEWAKAQMTALAGE
jgi:cytochrome c